MNGQEKLSVFSTELGYIKNDKLRDYLEDIIQNVIPDYFFEVPASSTGKYHPAYSLGKGGLVRHTQAAVRIAKGLAPVFYIPDIKLDFIVAALILHDTFKHGTNFSKYAQAKHPAIAAKIYKDYFNTKGEIEFADILYDLIITHMGQWNKDWKTNAEILPVPVTDEQKYVHLCDYLASRKYLEFKFDEEI